MAGVLLPVTHVRPEKSVGLIARLEGGISALTTELEFGFADQTLVDAALRLMLVYGRSSGTSSLERPGLPCAFAGPAQLVPVWGFEVLSCSPCSRDVRGVSPAPLRVVLERYGM